jgi:hypothetical protein
VLVLAGTPALPAPAPSAPPAPLVGEELDPSDGAAGACPFYRPTPEAERGGVPVRGTVAGLLGAYGLLCLVVVAASSRGLLRVGRMPHAMMGLSLAAVALLLALGLRWSRADVVGITRVTVTRPSGEGLERTSVSVSTFRQHPIALALPYPRSALRTFSEVRGFGTPFALRPVHAEPITDGPEPAMVIRGLAGEDVEPLVDLARPLRAPAGPLRIEGRDGQPWLVNATGKSFSRVMVCLGYYRRGDSVLARRWKLDGVLPAGEARALQPGGSFVWDRSPCDYTAPGEYELEAVEDAPDDVPVTTDPPLPRKVRGIRIVVGPMPEELPWR